MEVPESHSIYLYYTKKIFELMIFPVKSDFANKPMLKIKNLDSTVIITNHRVNAQTH